MRYWCILKDCQSDKISLHTCIFAYDPEFNVKEFWLHLKWLGVQNYLVTQLPKVHPKMFKPIMATIPQSLKIKSK